jgi:lysophospholipid acyltransferase (LPLAT)-like uncharacterized protein
MQTDYYIAKEEVKAKTEAVAKRLARIGKLVAPADSHAVTLRKELGRNAWTRLLDAIFAAVRRYAPPLHWLVMAVTAIALFAYARLVSLTARVVAKGELHWPHVPAPCVIALWHCDAPSLLIAFTKYRPRSESVVMVARDARGDALALLCRMLGFGVVRGGGSNGGWNSLVDLAHKLAEGACIFVTADGGGPARVAKIGAVALASAAGVPLIPLAAHCHPAIEERHKWDAARNPIPFCSVTVSLAASRTFEPFKDPSSIELARKWLQETLNALADKDV